MIVTIGNALLVKFPCMAYLTGDSAANRAVVVVGIEIRTEVRQQHLLPLISYVCSIWYGLKARAKKALAQPQAWHMGDVSASPWARHACEPE